MSDNPRATTTPPGQIEAEKDFSAYGHENGFRFRIPYTTEQYEILRQRDLILGMPSERASEDTQQLAMAMAIYKTLLVKAPSGFDFAKQEDWGDLLKLTGEVAQWQADFRTRVAGQKG